MATQGNNSNAGGSGSGNTMGSSAGPRAFKPKHFNEGIRSEAWLDAEIPLPSLYNPRPEESLVPAAPFPSRTGAHTPARTAGGASSTTTTKAAGDDATATAAAADSAVPSAEAQPLATGSDTGGNAAAEAEQDPDAEVADTVDPELRTQVEKNASRYLAKVADVQQSRGALQTLLESTGELQGRAHRLRAKLVTPYETLQTLQTDLVRLQLGTELVRRATRFEKLRWQLEDDMCLSQGIRPISSPDQDGEEDSPVSEEEGARALARAAFTSNEMTALITSPPPASLPLKLQDSFQELLTSLTPIAAALPTLRSAQDILRAHQQQQQQQMETPGALSATADPLSYERRGGERDESSRGTSTAPSTLSFGKRIEEFRQRMGRADTQFVPAPSMYY
ncbi:hypothetical protein A4X09_0g2495 [Tilletia walkeri]|uniref:Conserved oligomeric Golgi complex subunit 5 N-terminal domain-containing protein n=1 Tax=Tilletia walkeri TaxID=117179 RepID=A0A8X7T617_9BASI|nr:hypothetical protein A4X09_0g2495 [Tilletia walkeri]